MPLDPIQLLKAVILGLVEGATEFIPVSSSGHLIIVEDWLNFKGPVAETFTIFIQLGAILAIVWLYREKVLHVIKTLNQPDSQRFVMNLLIAFLPAALVGFFIHDWIKEYLFNPVTVAGALVVGGIVILIIERLKPHSRINNVDVMPVSTALWIGFAQVLSLFPGVSRSGATIMGAYSLGLSRKAAAEFSFFLAIPVMVAASGYDLFKSMDHLDASAVPILGTGFIVSFLSALIVVKVFLGFVSKHSFVGFAWYRIIFGIGLLAYHFLYAA